jgi:outer membrane protein assembly factor BamA
VIVVDRIAMPRILGAMSRLLPLLVCLLCSGLVPVLADEEDALDVEALLADDDLLDALLYGDAELSEETESVSALWNVENRLLLGGGYKKNALFSAFSQEDSAFTLTEWETTVFRLGQPTDWKFLGYVLVENRHYADVDGLDNEWLGIALAQVDKLLGHGWQVGVAGQYMYLEQAFSLEFEELDLGQTNITLHQFAVTPRAEVKLTDRTTWGFRLPVTFNRFQDSDQNYDEVGIVSDLRMFLTDKLKLRLSYGYEWRDYADRLERDRVGASIPGKELSWGEHQIALGVEANLDEAKRWRSKTGLRFRFVEDSGSGYNDFAMTSVTQSLTYQRDRWSIALNGSYTHYDYPVQTKEVGDTNHRYRARLGLGLDAKRKFGEAWEGLARYGFESYLSNVPDDQYDVHVFTLGLHHTF